MYTYHIHIAGLVQGVGFRPFVCRLANEYEINGWVSNTNNGVHIECTATEQQFTEFYNSIVHHPPPNAIISHHHFKKTNYTAFSSFSIRHSSKEGRPDLLLTPDIAICPSCKQELKDKSNKRNRYPFTTCLQCGPRFSIIEGLPYDRENTTMNMLPFCDACAQEYTDINNRRHYSQTNSCPDCAIPTRLYQSHNHILSSQSEEILETVNKELIAGKIIGVKGIGGYLLLCDASSESSIRLLRSRKHRPAKPFALMYPDMNSAGADAVLRSFEQEALQEKSAPVVLCKLRPETNSGICSQMIAPDLDRIGIMLPYSPLLFLISDKFGKPLVATSGNISNSPILYKDADALENLFEVADLVLTFDREIVIPQDDSVIQFTDAGQRIIMRRSRGLAPNYFPNPFRSTVGSILAMGSELKSSFALLDSNNLYISQYLGDQGTLESQSSFRNSLQHISGLIKAEPENILIDKHPAYSVSDFGKHLAVTGNKTLTPIQHHKAHFGAVLAENGLLNLKEPVLGFIWDGTGYGDDGQIWGGEVFLFEDKNMERLVHLDYFPQLLGDKMANEPRLSALSMLRLFPKKLQHIKHCFSPNEWTFYQQLLQQPPALLTSSMGRLLDGISAILGIRTLNTYEGEAAMQLEALARKCSYPGYEYFDIPFTNNRINWHFLVAELLEEYEMKKDAASLAYKVFFSLAKMVSKISRHFNIPNLAFSGGVFQNTLLIELLNENLQDKNLFFHRQLSPNDESIGFGQIACFSLQDHSQNALFRGELIKDIHDPHFQK
jgi:hydrogenase maturation protein HypF